MLVVPLDCPCDCGGGYGDPCTAEDVVFSFTRYKGVGAGEFKVKVKNVEVVDARTVRFHLHEPWPDFMTFYGTTTRAGITVSCGAWGLGGLPPRPA